MGHICIVLMSGLQQHSPSICNVHGFVFVYINLLWSFLVQNAQCYTSSSGFLHTELYSFWFWFSILVQLDSCNNDRFSMLWEGPWQNVCFLTNCCLWLMLDVISAVADCKTAFFQILFLLLFSCCLNFKSCIWYMICNKIHRIIIVSPVFQGICRKKQNISIAPQLSFTAS